MIAPALLARLKAARSLVVITGAGVSAESGVPTFRGAGGHWQQHRAEDLASPQGFRRDPELVWRWYHERREQVRACVPNPAHHAIVALEQHYPEFTLITQNVDGLHPAAGSRQMIEIHGSLWRLRCTREPKVWEARETLTEIPPTCSCGALARPDVLWFGESYDPDLLRPAARAAALADAILVVGTSGQVWIASGLLAEAAPDTVTLEINPEPGLRDQVDMCLEGPAGEILPGLVAAIRA